MAGNALDKQEAVVVEMIPKVNGKCCCSVAKSCLTLCDPTDCSTPGLPVPHYLLEFAQVHVHTSV